MTTSTCIESFLKELQRETLSRAREEAEGLPELPEEEEKLKAAQAATLAEAMEGA